MEFGPLGFSLPQLIDGRPFCRRVIDRYSKLQTLVGWEKSDRPPVAYDLAPLREQLHRVQKGRTGLKESGFTVDSSLPRISGLAESYENLLTKIDDRSEVILNNRRTLQGLVQRIEARVHRLQQVASDPVCDSLVVRAVHHRLIEIQTARTNAERIFEAQPLPYPDVEQCLETILDLLRDESRLNVGGIYQSITIGDVMYSIVDIQQNAKSRPWMKGLGE